MKKMKFLILTIIKVPFAFFTKISPLALIRNSKLSKKCAILSNTRFYDSNIDDYSYVGRNCFINNTKIGKFCSIADNCNIGLASHPSTWVSTSPVFYEGNNILKKNFTSKIANSSKLTDIGNDVWIGMNVCIKAGIKIGNGAIIGAGTIVTKDVEPYSIVGGNPGKLIRYRFDIEQREALLKSEWWNLEEDKLSGLSKNIDDVNMFLDMTKR